MRALLLAGALVPLALHYCVAPAAAGPRELSCEVVRDGLGYPTVVMRNRSGRSLERGRAYSFRIYSGKTLLGEFRGSLPYRLRPGGVLRDYFVHGVTSCDARLED